MTALTVTAKGQVTLKRDLLRHLGIEPGERIEVEALPGGELRVRAARPTGKIENVFGFLADKRKSKRAMTIDEMNEIIAAGWAGEFSDK
ncbi:hypothetical protein GCM10011491_27200 [Brucella endophytica]|uniref:SpoVT-AbrB domain-containing protein n=1 Tax=Brucella endophytica TaxID=1963359 RepID=A0A916SI75_9HYPH|nr:AbrB/MazE/SpoVT family DNA-binding domain-containing protein [Brucella endophytica]GGA97486.1 hypothetical protein GCM10011491_27200 [Brucella endophytica]